MGKNQRDWGYRAIVSREAFQQAGTGGGYRLALTDTGKVRLDLFQTHNTYVQLTGITTITPEVWTHVAGVFDGTQMRVYLNGVQNGTLSTTSGPTSGTGNLQIGRFSYSLNPYYFNGLIDDALVSNAALYTSNFTPSNNLTATGSTKGLWKFNILNTNDTSGNNNHGIVQGCATYSNDVFGTGGGEPSQVRWLVSDHLRTPRMIFDQSGSLVNTKRHDYLPFGEELNSGVGSRTMQLGYSVPDGVRQQFTSKERDAETGLDYFIARYYSPIQGRFTSPDEFIGGPDELYVLGSGDGEKQVLVYADVSNPQSLNKYQYTFNNPLRHIDSDGHKPQEPDRLHWDIMDLLEGRITEKEFHQRQQARALGAVAGLAVLAAYYYGPAVAVAILRWAAQNPDKVEQAGQMGLEAAGGPPGLILAPNSRLSKVERDSLERLGKQLSSRLLESSHVGEEVIVAGTRKTIDMMGNAPAYQHWKPADQAKFFASVKSHLLKSVDYIAIDLKGASKEQIAQITQYVNGLTKAERDRIIFVSP